MLVTDLGGRFTEITGNDVAGALLEFAATENATQLVVARSGRGRLHRLLRGSTLDDILRRAEAIDVHVIAP
ncbi:MAG: universal stress protein [Mycobacterium sp.]|nr:universal stress protein [Mycobacterium sp.]